MPKFSELSSLLDSDSLTLPILGKAYVIPPMSARDGLYAQRMMDLAVRAQLEQDAPRDPDKPSPPARKAPVLDDAEERDFYELVLSPAVLEEMVDDDLPWSVIQRAAQTAFLYATAGEEAAMARWTEGTPEGKAQTARPGSSGAGSSPTRAGSSGTRTSRRARQRTRRPGPGSSSAGT